MKIVGRILLGILFLLFFLLFVLLTTVYFEVLNSSFLFSSFERNHVYEKLPEALATSLPNDPNIPKEERGDYANIAKSIPPDVVKQTIETNLVSILAFIHGRSKDIVISIPAKELKLLGGKENIQLSLANIDNPEIDKRGQLLCGIGTKILVGWMIVFLLLVGLFILYGKLLQPKQLFGGSGLLFTVGGIVILISLVGKVFFMQIARELAKGSEPSQALLSILASSLLPDITTTWIIMGVFLIVLGFVLKMRGRTKLG